jgi:hypothetical protein
MSERGPEQSPNSPRFFMELSDGRKIECTPGNTTAYIHESEPDGDHLFVWTGNTDDGRKIVEYYWRDRLSNFDSIVMFMDKNGYDIYEDDVMTDQDRAEFKCYKETKMLQRMMEKTHDLYWISPRAEKQMSNTIDFMLHLLNTDKELLL